MLEEAEGLFCVGSLEGVSLVDGVHELLALLDGEPEALELAVSEGEGVCIAVEDTEAVGVSVGAMDAEPLGVSVGVIDAEAVADPLGVKEGEGVELCTFSSHRWFESSKSFVFWCRLAFSLVAGFAQQTATAAATVKATRILNVLMVGRILDEYAICMP